MSFDQVFSEYMLIKQNYFEKGLAKMKGDIQRRFEEYAASKIGEIQKPLADSERVEIDWMKKTLLNKTLAVVESLRSKVAAVELRTMKEVQVFLEETTEVMFARTARYWDKHIELFSLDSAKNSKSWQAVCLDNTKKKENFDSLDKVKDFKIPLVTQVADSVFTEHQQTSYKPKEVSATSIILPLSAVNTLNEWVSNNRHDPYPTKEEKEILATKAGITVKQVNNWLVNYRCKRHSISTSSEKFKDQICSSIAEDTGRKKKSFC